ncbi:MAG: Hsp20/alpha crystallin family protein [Flavobacteriales bacterium]|nr:Hsp20/alpha crystallin family protein [Flavobacteriales bacterium]
MTTPTKRSTLLPSLMDDDNFGFPSNFVDADWGFPTQLFNTPFFRNANLPAVNIKENDASFDVELAVPGYKKEDLKVAVEGDLLTISSEKKNESEEDKNGYTRREFNYRSFQRSFQLPQNVDGDNVKATFMDGVLKLSIPKTKALPEKKGKEVRIA